MKKIIKFAFILFLVGCSTTTNNENVVKLKPYDDVRGNLGRMGERVLAEDEYVLKDMMTYTYNEGTIFKGNEKKAKEIMDLGRNPGLNIEELHAKSITGKDVNVAIIDQPLIEDHPEYKGKIKKYHTIGEVIDNSSMHGPAVTSILVGESIGVAPKANVYYVAVPSWEQDSKNYAEAIDWIIEENSNLPETNKIKVISISAAPTGPGSPFDKNQNLYEEAVLRAKSSGILILDCVSENKETGIIMPAYCNLNKPNDLSACKMGFPNRDEFTSDADFIGAPSSFRTVAEVYEKNKFSYTYDGVGGLSWSIPYVSGVLALGWQVNPNLSSEEIVSILKESSYINVRGAKIIDPKAFIEAIVAD